jgi:hypothetical protein
MYPLVEMSGGNPVKTTFKMEGNRRKPVLFLLEPRGVQRVADGSDDWD